MIKLEDKKNQKNSAEPRHYDKKYVFGNTTVYVVAPKITEEEKQRRWESFREIATQIFLESEEREANHE